MSWTEKPVYSIEYEYTWILGETAIERRRRCGRIAFLTPTSQTMKDCPVSLGIFGYIRITKGKFPGGQRIFEIVHDDWKAISALTQNL